MKRTLIFCCLSSFAFVLSAQGPRGGRMMAPRNVTPVTGAPYSATRTIQTNRVLANGNQISRTDTSQVYRDSQGRTRTERTITPSASSGKQPFTEVTITDPVAGFRYVLNSSTTTAIQMPLPAPRTSNSSGTQRQPLQINGAQESTVDLGTQTINGVTATGTQLTETIPAGAIGNSQPIVIVRTTWTSTALKVPVQIKSSDPRFGTTNMELTNIQQSEPAASLFTVPSGYTVKTAPSGPGGRGGPRGMWPRN
jgi:hypothetical protein